MRVEKDFLGGREIPDDALYGLQSLRAKENFALSYRPVHPKLLRAFVLVKKAAAVTYQKLAGREGGGRDEIYRAIAAACDALLEREESFSSSDLFVTCALQGGAGTSINMNVNEVLANLALRIMGEAPGAYHIIHPVDNVNRGQSTNDVFPTALRIAAIGMLRDLSAQCAALQESLQRKETEFADVSKVGRTELMDAVPVTLGEEFGAYAQALGRDRWRLYKAEERLRQVNIGGTAVGLGGNAERAYRFAVLEELRALSGMGLAAAEYPMDITQNNDVFVEVSGLLKSLAVNLTKIANDLRLMQSGPAAGLGEITLPPLQQGSTIMPGKVNPVIPEMVIQAGLRVMANDAAISGAASRGDFELNAFLPLIADALLESLGLLCEAARLFRVKCVDGIAADRGRCAALLDASLGFAASYLPALGYEAVSAIVRDAGGDAAKARRALEAAAAFPR